MNINNNILTTRHRYEKEAFEMLLDNQKHLIKLHDTAGQEDYERLRTVIYKEVRN